MQYTMAHPHAHYFFMGINMDACVLFTVLDGIEQGLRVSTARDVIATKAVRHPVLRERTVTWYKDHKDITFYDTRPAALSHFESQAI